MYLRSHLRQLVKAMDAVISDATHLATNHTDCSELQYVVDTLVECKADINNVIRNLENTGDPS